MSVKTVEALRALKLFNTWELLGAFAERGQDVACSFVSDCGRGGRGRDTYVVSPSHNTDPGAPWYNNGRKAFSGKIGNSMPLAIAWASERYGIKEWAACPIDRNARVPKIVRERALAAIKKAKVRP